MLPIERRNEILSKLMLDGRVIVSDLSALYDVTEETIRRDLDKLEKDGLAKKTYGGAVRNDNLNVDLPYTIRKQTNVEGKKYIAELIGKFIGDGENILLDSSTTALYTIKSIYNRSNMTIITNSIEMLMDAPLKSDWNFISNRSLFSPCVLFGTQRLLSGENCAIRNAFTLENPQKRQKSHSKKWLENSMVEH